jgi:hypothetical protein
MHMNRTSGWLIALFVLGGVAVVLALNLNLVSPSRKPIDSSSQASVVPDPAAAATPPASDQPDAPFREFFIGEPATRAAEALEIAAVYFPAVPMDGMPMPASEHALHIEADVRATAGNPNGFALGQFIPYMKVRYLIEPAAGGAPLSGELVPMVARDGLHYGATVIMPGPGTYRLTYSVAPPSVGGLGRHSDPVTGVASWWSPFEVSWDWDYAP